MDNKSTNFQIRNSMTSHFLAALYVVSKKKTKKLDVGKCTI